MAGSDTRAPAAGGRAAEAETEAEAGGFLSRWSRRKALVRQGSVPAEPVPEAHAVADVATLTAPVARSGAVRVDDPAPAMLAPGDSTQSTPPPPQPPQPVAPTLADVDLLNRDSDYGRFVQPGVDAGVRNAALKKLFSDPHFNLMDRLDTYIDDYSLPDPLPAGMLRQMVQSHALGLFDEDPEVSAGLDAANPPDMSNLGSSAHGAEPEPETAPDPSPEPLLAPLPEPIPEPIQAPDEDPDLRLQPHLAAGPAGPGPGLVPDPGCER